MMPAVANGSTGRRARNFMVNGERVYRGEVEANVLFVRKRSRTLLEYIDGQRVYLCHVLFVHLSSLSLPHGPCLRCGNRYNMITWRICVRSFNLGKLKLASCCRAGKGAPLYLKLFRDCIRGMTKTAAKVTRSSFILALCFADNQSPSTTHIAEHRVAIISRCGNVGDEWVRSPPVF